MELLIQYVRYYVKLNDEEEKALFNAFTVEHFSKDHQLLEEERTSTKLYFVLSGTVRTFYHHGGKEVTTWIYPEGYFVTAWTSYLQNKPSFEAIEVVEDARIAAISKTKLEQLFDDFPRIERFGRRLMEDQLAYVDEYSKGYNFKSAKEKYEELLSFFPDITQRINLGHIASFLGISQETLSRIRRGDK